jgi:hypothetical protein
VHPRFVQAEGEVVAFPSEPVEAWARFDEFFEVEHERLFKALYFVTGNRQDAEELMQDAFLKLWERWGEIHRISDPVDYLNPMVSAPQTEERINRSLRTQDEPSENVGWACVTGQAYNLNIHGTDARAPTAMSDSPTC